MDAPLATEFARPIELSRLNHGEQRFAINANASERAALAARFGLVSLDKLEPVRNRVAESFAVLYGEGGEAREVTLDGEAETIEPIVGGVIDIGEAVAQQLSLALNPFPHAPGA